MKMLYMVDYPDDIANSEKETSIFKYINYNTVTRFRKLKKAEKIIPVF